MSRPALPKWIQLEDALEIEGSKTIRALTCWIDRWNDNPDTEARIKRRYGKVELNSLLAAMEEDERRYGQRGNQVKSAYLALAGKSRPRTKTPSQQKGAH